VPQSLDDGTVVAVSVGARAELGADGKQRRKGSSFEQFAPMVVDFVLKAGISCRVGTPAGAREQSNDRSA